MNTGRHFTISPDTNFKTLIFCQATIISPLEFSYSMGGNIGRDGTKEFYFFRRNRGGLGSCRGKLQSWGGGRGDGNRFCGDWRWHGDGCVSWCAGWCLGWRYRSRGWRTAWCGGSHRNWYISGVCHLRKISARSNPAMTVAAQTGLNLPPFPCLVLADDFDSGFLLQIAQEIIDLPRTAAYLQSG